MTLRLGLNTAEVSLSSIVIAGVLLAGTVGAAMFLVSLGVTLPFLEPEPEPIQPPLPMSGVLAVVPAGVITLVNYVSGALLFLFFTFLFAGQVELLRTLN
jgi:hypothetical protein